MTLLIVFVLAVGVYAQTTQVTAITQLYTACSGLLTDVQLCTSCTPVVCDASNNVIEFNSLLVPSGSSYNFFHLSPYVGNLTYLQYFVITNRMMNDPIPAEFGLLQNLSFLNLATNGLTGTIPSELGNATALLQLSLFGNALTGTIPTELGRLTGMTFLSFDLNRLSGPIPTEFGALTNCSNLGLAENQLSGDIPTEIGRMTSLTNLRLIANRVTGWPDELGNLTLLTYFDISANRLTGTVPSSFGRMASLDTLRANVNYLDGTLPTELGDLSQLSSLELFHNNLFGTIPTELGRCKRLYVLRLHSNQFNGTIPTEFGGLNISILVLSYNQLSGAIPTEIGNMPILSQLSITNTLVSGPIPTQFGLLKKLSILRLESNRLNGTIPTEFANSTILGSLYLSKNALTGSVPDVFRNMWGFTGLFLDQNNIVGPLPYFNTLSQFSCAGCMFGDGDVAKDTSIKFLILSGNLFSRLPDFLFNGSTVSRADLTSNRISDTLEDKLFSPKLQSLQLGFNFLTGNPTLHAETSFAASLASQIELQGNRLDGQQLGLLQAATGELGFFDAGLQDVDECALGTHNCDQYCVDGWLPLYSFTCGCSNNTVPFYALGPDARTCYPCYLSTALDVESAASFAVLNQAPYASVRDQLPFASCSACNNGKRYVSQNFSTPECGLVAGPVTVGPCSFPCVGLKDIVGATEAIFILNQELSKDGFVETLVSLLFNVTLLSVNQTAPSRRREASVYDLDLGLEKRYGLDENQAAPTGVAASALGFTFLSSTNCSEIAAITNLLATLSAEIVPRATLSFTADPSTCSMTTTASNPPASNDQALALGIGLGVGLAFVLLLIIVVGFLLYQYFYQDPMMLLPKEVRWSFHQYKTKPYKWTFQGSDVSWYHYLRYERGSWEWDKVEYLMTMLGGEDMLTSVTSITAIYNRQLTRAFVGQWMVMKERLRTQPELFGKKLVRHASEDVQNLQDFVYSKYYDLTRNFNWNDDNIVPILPTVHGTEEPIAEKIAQTGFANLSSLDAGYFGKGIYFTFSLPYAIPYIFAKRLPACIISYILPGNIYAVTESHRVPEETLLGTALKQNASSHFVLTDVNGHVITSREQKNYYTEICIGQESQVVPAFIVTFDVADGRKMIEEWGNENGTGPTSSGALGHRADLEASSKPLLESKDVVVDI